LRVNDRGPELSNDNSITLNQPGSSLTIPSVKTRRAETTLEFRRRRDGDGRLDSDQTKQASTVAGLTQLPVLGRCSAAVTSSTPDRADGIVRPFIVRAVAQKTCRAPMTDSRRRPIRKPIWIGNINRIYGVPAGLSPPELSRHLWLYHRLRRDEDETMT